MARRLPYECAHGNLAANVRALWDSVDGFVLFAAAGACVRIVAPLLTEKANDPGVVCVDEAGRFAVALLGGHSARANTLAREVARSLGAEPVITTATDAIATAAIDQLGGLAAEGAIAAVTAAMVDGRSVIVDNPRGWPLPPALERALLGRTGEPGPGAQGPEAQGPAPLDGPRLLVTDELVSPSDNLVVLRPPSIVAGIGASTSPPAEEVSTLLGEALAHAGLSRLSLRAVATIDRRATEVALTSLGLPIHSYRSAELATVDVPNPSAAVSSAVGTPSVAEAAALRAAGPGATLVVEKRRSAHATVALARSCRPTGHLAIVGLGPGGPGGRTPDADRSVRRADVVVGYEPYIDQCADLLGPSVEVIRSPIGAEVERARIALGWAELGLNVSVVSSGDAGIYAMASVVLEEAGDEPGFEIEVVPGVTAGVAAAALLGAPLGHDHMVVSLSDLLTPWELILRRVVAARDADLVLVIYNPKSKARDWQLAAVRDVMLEGRSEDTPVGIATDVGRERAQATITTLALLDPDLVGMTTCVIVGSSETRIIGNSMVTPRGYVRPEDTLPRR
jgi:cobalt-precorrin 5A hydrolase/precorrin-3B C17-methyltransferase